MSKNESVFLPSNGNAQFQDLLSATSAPNWSKVANENGTDGQAKHLMSEINGLLSEVRKSNTVVDQAGGKKKRKSASSKSASSAKPKKAKKASSKKMKRASSSKKAKKAKKASSKKASSAKKTKKASSSKKRMSGGEMPKKKREMPQAMKDIRTLAKVILAEIPDLKDGIPMATTASKLIKTKGGLENAIEEVKKNKSAVAKLYKQIAKEQQEKRDQKKADKSKCCCSEQEY